MFEPKNDGVDHINIYSKGKTELGKLLTNFAHTPFDCDYGHFESVEGFWYWLKTLLLDTNWSKEQKVKIEILRSAYGYEAKKLGRELLSKNIDESDKISIDENFKSDILKAIRCKLNQNKHIKMMLARSNLPFAHYYFYGKEDNPKIYELPEYHWQIEYFEKVRTYLKERDCQKL